MIREVRANWPWVDLHDAFVPWQTWIYWRLMGGARQESPCEPSWIAMDSARSLKPPGLSHGAKLPERSKTAHPPNGVCADRSASGRLAA